MDFSENNMPTVDNLRELCEQKFTEEEMDICYEAQDEVERFVDDQQYRLESCRSILDDILEITKQYDESRGCTDPYQQRIHALMLKYAAAKNELY